MPSPPTGAAGLPSLKILDATGNTPTDVFRA